MHIKSDNTKLAGVDFMNHDQTYTQASSIHWVIKSFFLELTLSAFLFLRYNFNNIIMHETDFGIPCSWNFFATSHGKRPCDGIGGTVKRLTARASLQRPIDNQILTPKDMFDFAKANIKGLFHD